MIFWPSIGQMCDRGYTKGMKNPEAYLGASDLELPLLLMEEVLHHLACIKPSKQWIFIISTGGFLPSTVSFFLSTFCRMRLTDFGGVLTQNWPRFGQILLREVDEEFTSSDIEIYTIH